MNKELSNEDKRVDILYHDFAIVKKLAWIIATSVIGILVHQSEIPHIGFLSFWWNVRFSYCLSEVLYLVGTGGNTALNPLSLSFTNIPG